MKPFFVRKNMSNGSIITIDNTNSQAITVSGALNGNQGDQGTIKISPYNSQMTEQKDRPKPIEIELTIDSGTSQNIDVDSFICYLEKIEISVTCSQTASVNLCLNGGNL